MKRKIYSLFVIIVLFFITFSSGLNQAHADRFSCGGSTLCKEASMTYGKQQYVASGQLWFSSGETIFYGWGNDRSGLMQVSFSVYDGSTYTRVSKELVATGGGSAGENGGVYKVTKSGYYYLFAACEGGNDDRCSGSGYLKY